MAMVTIGGFFGEAQKDVDLIPIFRENELSKNPNSSYKADAQGMVIPVPKQNIPRHAKVKYIFFLKSLLFLLNNPEIPLNI